MSKNENRTWDERAALAKSNVALTNESELDAELLRRREIIRADLDAVTEKADQKGSVKFDASKPALQYVPGVAMEKMGDAFAYGALKYGGNNYKISGLEVSRCIGAALRHVYKFNDGVDLDEESQKHHLGHAMAAIAMALYMLENHPHKDDRFKK